MHCPSARALGMPAGQWGSGPASLRAAEAGGWEAPAADQLKHGPCLVAASPRVRSVTSRSSPAQSTAWCSAASMS